MGSVISRYPLNVVLFRKRDDLFLEDYTACENYDALLQQYPYTRIRSELDEKRKRLLLAATRNDVEQVKALLDSPKMYGVTEKNGLNLLQIAIIRKNVAVFDYLLSLEDYPLELVNDEQETAFITAVCGRLDEDDDFYFAEQLVKRGANLSHRDSLIRTVWYCSVKSTKMMKLLIDAGVDVNTGSRHFDKPLHTACRYGNDEVVAFLLFCGADPTSQGDQGLIPFECAVLQKNPFQQEMLFQYTFDEFSQHKIRWRILLNLANQKSPLFEKFDALVMDGSDYSSMKNGQIEELFQVDVASLKKLLMRFKSELRGFLPLCGLHFRWRKNYCILEKIDVLVRSGLGEEVIKCVQNTNTSLLLHYLIELFDEGTVTQIVCYLLSYGLPLTQDNLEAVYEGYGYCELFKVMLHMDFEFSGKILQIVPSFIYDVRWDFKTCLLKQYSFVNVEHLLAYFSDPEIKEFCRKACGDSVLQKIESIPQIPSLVEVARNVFRKYVIHRYNIRSVKHLHSFVNGLCINDVYKKIITYEKAIY